MSELTATEIAEILLGIRRKLLRIVLIIVTVWAISFAFVSDWIIEKVKHDLLPKGAQLIYQYPLEPLMLKLRISLYLGVAVAMPYIVHTIYTTLKERTDLLDNVQINRSRALKYLVVGAILFTIGVAYGYMIMLPLFMKFLYNLAVQQGALAYYTITDFVGFVVLMLVVFGFVFEMPLIMCILVANGIVKYETLKYYRRHFYVAFFIIGAAITPPDVFTQLMVAVPMVVFFEISLVVIRILYRDRIEGGSDGSVHKADRER